MVAVTEKKNAGRVLCSYTLDNNSKEMGIYTTSNASYTAGARGNFK
jgi:hypothetical protein